MRAGVRQFAFWLALGGAAALAVTLAARATSRGISARPAGLGAAYRPHEPQIGA
jgi:hypothetical protein